jgi:hypothetical protein
VLLVPQEVVLAQRVLQLELVFQRQELLQLALQLEQVLLHRLR